MWLGACCLFTTLLLAIIGVAVDILIVDQGSTLFSGSVTLHYGWQELRWTFNDIDFNGSNSVLYQDAYNNYCNGTSSTFCSDLEDLMDAGRVYVSFSIIGIVILTAALGLSILAALGKCLCSKRCRLGWIVAILCTFSMICFLIAFSVFLNNYSTNVNLLFNIETNLVYSDWDSAYVGGSILLLIIGGCLGITSLSCILCAHKSRRLGGQYAVLYDPNPVVNGPPPPTYGEPTPYGEGGYGQGPYNPGPYGPPPGPYPGPYGQPPGPYGAPPPGYTVPPGVYYQQAPYNNVTPV